MEGNKDSVCIVTHPLSDVSETAVSGLLEVVSATAGRTSLITANLPDDSNIWDEYEVIEVNEKDTGVSIAVAAFRFAFNQIRICQELRNREEKTVLFFGATSYLLPILCARLFDMRVILEPRGNVPDSLYRIWADRLPGPIAYLLSRIVWLLERIGYFSADAILTLSPAMSADLGLETYGSKLYEYGARPVDIERFQPNVPFEDRDRRIGYLGRLDEEKGVDVLTEVVAHLPDNITFVFIGDGALRSRIEADLSEKLERGSVEITGWIDHEDVPEYLNELRLLVMTSRTEGVPTTALEAMACGTPVCATPVGGIPDVVTDGETGILLESDGPEAIADRIETALNEESLPTMSATAREFVVENYSFEVVVKEYKRVFEAVR